MGDHASHGNDRVTCDHRLNLRSALGAQGLGVAGGTRGQVSPELARWHTRYGLLFTTRGYQASEPLVTVTSHMVAEIGQLRGTLPAVLIPTFPVFQVSGLKPLSEIRHCERYVVQDIRDETLEVPIKKAVHLRLGRPWRSSPGDRWKETGRFGEEAQHLSHPHGDRLVEHTNSPGPA